MDRPLEVGTDRTRPAWRRDVRAGGGGALRTAGKAGGGPPMRLASRLATEFAFISLHLSHHLVPFGFGTAIVAQTPLRGALPHLPGQEDRGGGGAAAARHADDRPRRRRRAAVRPTCPIPAQPAPLPGCSCRPSNEPCRTIYNAQPVAALLEAGFLVLFECRPGWYRPAGCRMAGALRSSTVR